MGGRISAFVAGIAATVLLGAATVAAANGIPDAAGVIHACYGTDNGQLRVVADGSQCKNNEAAIQWNEVGTQGPQGDPGVAGERGEQGPPGDSADVQPLLDELATLAQLLTDLEQRLDDLETTVAALEGDGGDGGDGGGNGNPDAISYGTDVGECVSGLLVPWPEQVLRLAVGPTVELFDGLDNDCDGATDEGSLSATDIDGDGIPNPDDNCASYPNPDQEDTTHSGVGDYCLALAGEYWGDCEYYVQHPLIGIHLPLRLPRQPEIPDGLDNDCDGSIDPKSFTRVDDQDGDGVSDSLDNCPEVANPDQQSTLWPDAGDACVITRGTDVGACEFEVSYLGGGASRVLYSGIGPTTEIVNGVDDDCDGEVDEGL